MKFPMMVIGLVFGVFVLWGCSVSSPSETDEANEVSVVEEVETDNLNQVDEVSETNETTFTEETNEVEQTEHSEESVQVDDTEQATEAEVVDEVDEIEEVEVVSDSNEASEASEVNQTEETTEVEVSNQDEEISESIAVDRELLANVISVEARGDPGSYTFVVGIASPDEGCQQFADWWEVLNEDGELIYRRVLLHSHVNEQPFVRSGGPVEIAADQTVLVRAHMNTSGYGVVAFKGSVQSGFQETELSPEFAIEAAGLAPLPTGCDF